MYIIEWQLNELDVRESQTNCEIGSRGAFAALTPKCPASWLGLNVNGLVLDCLGPSESLQKGS